MKNVRRLDKPPSLDKHGENWTEQLLKEIDKVRGHISKVPESSFIKYNTDDVKSTLYNMYDALCCYCEERVGVVEYANIEHRKPKRKFPGSTYEWDNMHLSCTTCNTQKGDKYNKKYPILDAVLDNPIEEHLEYKVSDSDGVYLSWKTKRGETTVEDTDLNRPRLKEQRSYVCARVLQVILAIKRAPHSSRARRAKANLLIQSKGRYGSMIRYFMKQNNV